MPAPPLFEVNKMLFKIDTGWDGIKYFEKPEDVVDYCIDEDYYWDSDEGSFEEWINDREEYVVINGMTYYPYQILDALDYGNLQDLRHEYCSEKNENDEEDAYSEMRNAEIGKKFTIQCYEVEIIEDWEREEGDTDGDKSVAEMIKQFEEPKISEDDMMEMFQVTGG